MCKRACIKFSSARLPFAGRVGAGGAGSPERRWSSPLRTGRRPWCATRCAGTWRGDSGRLAGLELFLDAPGENRHFPDCLLVAFVLGHGDALAVGIERGLRLSGFGERPAEQL